MLRSPHWLRYYIDIRTGPQVPLVVGGVEGGVDEDAPVGIIQVRVVGAVVVTGPAGLLPVQQVAHVGLTHPGAMHHFPAA